jgi:hypothetical protein
MEQRRQLVLTLQRQVQQVWTARQHTMLHPHSPALTATAHCYHALTIEMCCAIIACCVQCMMQHRRRHRPLPRLPLLRW